MSWWVVGVISSNPSAGQVVQFVTESASKPPLTAAEAKKFGSEYGSVEWVLGPYATKAAAQTAMGTAGTAPGKYTGAGGLPSGLEAIGAFFNKIGSRAFMVRAVKVVLGAGLIVVGVVQLSGAGSVAKKIASDIKVVPV